MSREPLHAALLDAHKISDKSELVGLYVDAAEIAENDNEACFFLTQAYVFALEMNDPRAATLHAKLKAVGREA